MTIKERPIAYEANMARRIHRSEKSSFRKPIINQPCFKNGDAQIYHYVKKQNGQAIWRPGLPPVELCPHGKPSDRLWLREPYALAHGSEPHAYTYGDECIVYACDVPMEQQHQYQFVSATRMPKRFCRLKLNITDVHVKRLRDINAMDIWFEGIRLNLPDYYKADDVQRVYREAYQDYWYANHKNKREYGWSANPYVWVVEFDAIIPEFKGGH